MEARRPLPLRVALPLFFLVGAGALVVETTWMRWFRGTMGATAPAISAALVSVAMGQLVGALLGGRLAERTRTPLRAFGGALLVAGFFSLAVEPMLTRATAFVELSSAGSGTTRTLTRLGASLAATLPASASIGAALPLLVAATSRDAHDLGPRGVSLYAADLVGAALGAGVTVFWLPNALGVSGAYTIGVALLLGPGLVAAALRGFTQTRGATPRPGPRPTPSTRRFVIAVSAASGFATFAAEVLLHQAFGRVLDQSTFALGAVLVTTLLSLAAGAVVVVSVQHRVRAPLLVASAAAVAAVSFAWFPAAFDVATKGLTYVVSKGFSRGYVPQAMMLVGLTSGPALVAAAAVLPALFVLAGRRSDGHAGVAGRLAGSLLAANTFGAVVGALAAPYLLLPNLSLWPSFLCIAILYAVVAVVASGSGRYAWAFAITLFGLIVFATPWRVPGVRLADGDTLLEVTTTPQGMVAVVERDGERFIQTDNHYLLGGTKDTTHQERQGHLPLLLHPSPQRVAFIGTATGSTASAALDHDVESLVTVEIMPGVTGAARRFFAEDNAGVFDDPRTEVVIDDARSYLRRPGEPFDVIVADLFVPWRSETGSLYTLEHFERARNRLRPGGLFCQWLPLYQMSPAELESIMATFLDVFPDAQVFRGDFFGAYGIVALVGGRAAKLDPSRASEQAVSLGARGVDDRWVTHPVGPSTLYVGPLAALSDRLKDAPRNTEDQPFVELQSARNPARHGGRDDWTAAGEPFLDLSRILHEAAWRSERPSKAHLRALEGGYFLQAASVHWTAGDSERAGEALSKAADLLPAELLGRAAPDPSAADVWHVGP